MKAIGLAFTILLLWLVSALVAEDFIIGAHLDPYTLHGDTTNKTLIQEYFDSLKSFGVNRVIGWGDSISTKRGQPTALGSFKVLPFNSVYIYGSNPLKTREVEVTTQEPKTLEKFTTFGWHMILEVEKRYNVESDLKDFGCGFYHQTGSFGGDSAMAIKNQDAAGYLFAGPGSISQAKSSGLYFSPKFMRPGTWGRADYVLKLDTTTVPDTTIVARLVVYNANHYRGALVGYESELATLKDSNACRSSDAFATSICLCHDTTVISPRHCGSDTTYKLRYDDDVLLDIDTNPDPDTIRKVADAFIRDLKRSDFCNRGQYETLSVHFYQPYDYPFQYSLYWTNKVTLTANRVIVSNDTGRVFFDIPLSAMAGKLDTNYLQTLLDTVPRMFLTDEPYTGSYQVVRRGKDVITSPSISSLNKPTNTIGGYTAPSVEGFQWDLLNSIAQVDQYNLEVYPINCSMQPDSSTDTVDACSIQKGFNIATRNLAFLSSKAKPTANNKPFWPWVQLFGFWDGGKQITRIPTPTEVKAQVNLALAYGAKGILYFQYTTTGDRSGAGTQVPLQAMPMVATEGGGGGCGSCPTGTAPYRISGVMKWNGSTKYVKVDTLWDSVKSINVNILKKLGPTLVTLTWDTAGSAQNAGGSTHSFLDSVKSDKYSASNMFVEVAHYTGGGADYFMMVNRRCKSYENQTLTSWIKTNTDTMLYVIDVLKNDTVVTGTVSSNTAPFTTSLAAAEGKLFKVIRVPGYLHGTVYHKAWQGKIKLDGDVTVPSGKTLKVLYPKAQVRFLANRDTTHSGVSTSKVEIIVSGSLLVTGTAGDSVKFFSDAGTPGTQDWYGVRVLAGGSFNPTYGQFKNAYCGLDYQNSASDLVNKCLLEKSEMYGLYTKNGNLTVQNSKFKDLNGYGIYLDSCNATVSADTLTNVTMGINAYKSYGIISGNVITAADLQFPSFGFRAEGVVPSPGTQKATFSDDSLAASFDEAGVIAAGGVAIRDCRIWTKAPSSWPDPVPQLIGILGLGTATATVRNTTVKMFSSGTTTTPAVKVTGKPVLDLGGNCDNSVQPPICPDNRIFRAGSNAKAVLNTTDTTVLAKNNWWGTANPPSSYFSSLVTYSPALSSDPYDEGSPKVAVRKDRLPDQFSIDQNYPNPFNPTTTISFSLPTSEKVRLDVYNIQGQRVKTLIDGERAAGVYQVVWDGRDKNGFLVSSGVYFYKIETASFKEVKRMVFLK